MAHVDHTELHAAEREHLVCTYACLLLGDSGLDIDADKIQKVAKSTGNKVSAFLPGMFARAFANHDVMDLVNNAGASCGGGGGAPAAASSAPAAGGDAKPAAAAKEEEPEEEVDMDLGGMFGDEY